MRTRRLVLAGTCVGCAAAALALALDVSAWQARLREGDAGLGQAPAAASWEVDALLPGDPARRLLQLGDDLRLRAAIRAYLIAARTPRGFDLGEGRARARSRAEAQLADVAAGDNPKNASLAENLFGVLVHRTGRVADGSTAEERSLAAFETAVRLDPENVDAKYNLELLLQRARPGETREGPSAGAGPRGTGRRGAGAGTPGRGY